MIGEGYHQAISEAEFFKPDTISALENRVIAKAKLIKLFRELKANISSGAVTVGEDLSTQELWALYYKAYLDMKIVLGQYPMLSKFLWKIGANGVSDGEYDKVVDELPLEYRDLVSSQFVYFEKPVSTLISLKYIIFGRGIYKIDLVGMIASILPLTLISGIFMVTKSINRRIALL